MSGSNGSATLLKRRRALEEKISPKRVDFFTQAQDLRCVMLAAAGLTTTAIAKKTGYTEAQVAYRIGKSEKGRKRGDLTQRAAYRMGSSPVANLIVALVGSNRSPIKRQVTETLDKRGLYTPLSRGVLRDDRALPKR